MPNHDLVVVVPGILGSVLERDGHLVWDVSPRALLPTLRALARGRLTLKTDGYGPPGDGVRATRIIRGVRVLPGLTSVHGYAPLTESLASTLPYGREQVRSFPYDWRLSNQYNAVLLGTFVERELDRWRKVAGPRAQCVLVCHSMGGLLGRYFCEVLEGRSIVRRLITVGTPHRGSVNAVSVLSDGKRFGPLDLTSLAESCPSLAELLPTFPCVAARGGGHKYLSDEPAGIPLERIRQGADFHRRIGDATAGRPDIGDGFTAVMNRFLPTAQSITVHAGQVEIIYSYGGEDFKGDGTVPSFAALPPEWDDDARAVHIAVRHGAMQTARVVALHATAAAEQLTGLWRMRESRLEERTVGLEVPWVADAHRPIDGSVVAATSGLRLRAAVRDLLTGAWDEVGCVDTGGGYYQFTTQPLPEGVYAVEVSGGPGSPVLPDGREVVVIDRHHPM